MPVAVQQQQATTMSTVTNQQPLRRAVYVHVSDLTSAYNIDHGRLEQELERVKVEHRAKDSASAPKLPVPTELDTSAPQRRLQPPRTGYNLCLLVGEVNLVVDKNRVDGTRVRLAEVEVGDETGTVSLRARDEQIDLLREVSQRSGAIVLRNCALELYQGKHIRLATTKWGKLSPYPDQIASTPPPPSKINRDRNFSLIDLSVVASEMVSFAQADPYSQSLEGENQPSSMMNRSQPYQNSSFRGGRGRRPSPKQQHSGAPAPMPHYSDPRLASMPYPSGLHGYSGMDTSGYSTYRQQENLTSAQQMMLHQQYEMQHRQMHQMYSPQEQRSPMMSPVIPPAASFDTSFSVGSEVPMPVPGSNPFLMPIQTSPPQGPGQSPQAQASRGQQQQQQQPSPQQASTPETPGKMNPQAATFDPSYRSHYSRK